MPRYKLPEKLARLLGTEIERADRETEAFVNRFDNTILAVECGGAWFDLQSAKSGRERFDADVAAAIKALMGRPVERRLAVVKDDALLFVFDGPANELCKRLEPLPLHDGQEYQAIIDARAKH